MVVLLRVAAAGDVEAVDAARRSAGVGGVEVEAGEQRDDREPLHGRAEVAADHRGQPVGLAVQGELGALDLLVVLELDLVQPDDLDRDAGRAGDADQAVVVGGEHLLDVALGDQVAHGGAPVAGHHDAAVEDRGDDRGAVGQRRCGRRPAAGARRQLIRVPGSSSAPPPRTRKSRRRTTNPSAVAIPQQSRVRTCRRSLAALLDEAADEVLGVGLQHLVDVVQDRVDVVGELLVPLGDVSWCPRR